MREIVYQFILQFLTTIILKSVLDLQLFLTPCRSSTI